MIKDGREKKTQLKSGNWAWEGGCHKERQMSFDEKGKVRQKEGWILDMRERQV